MSNRTRKWPAESRWRRPLTLTVLGELPPEKSAAARQALQTGAAPFGLEDLAQLHYLRIFVVDAEEGPRGQVFPPRLVLSAVFDGETEQFVRDWIALAGDRLAMLFAFCVDFPKRGGAQEVRDWLFHHAHRPETFHIGAVRHQVADIRAESALHDAIQTFADRQCEAGVWDHGNPCRIHQDIQKHVALRQDLPRAPRGSTPWRIHLLQLLDLLKIIATPLIPTALAAWLLVAPARQSPGWLLIFTLLILGGLSLLWFLTIRLYESLEPDVVVRPAPGHVAALVDREDFGSQNQFTMLTPVRDSRFRRLNLRLTLWLSNGFSRHLWNRGKLSGVATIHFARFHRLDNGRRLLFMSDFDGGWDRYLFDFLSLGSFAVVPNWTNLHGCPKTRFLIWPTRGFGQRFLPFTRANQRPTDLWYCAIGHLTLHDIQRNARVRAGLFDKLNETKVRAWLALF